MTPEIKSIQARLFAVQSRKYQAFQSRLMSTVPPETKQHLRALRIRSQKL